MLPPCASLSSSPHKRPVHGGAADRLLERPNEGQRNADGLVQGTTPTPRIPGNARCMGTGGRRSAIRSIALHRLVASRSAEAFAELRPGKQLRAQCGRHADCRSGDRITPAFDPLSIVLVPKHLSPSTCPQAPGRYRIDHDTPDYFSASTTGPETGSVTPWPPPRSSSVSRNVSSVLIM
jgi:hypothetical protein